MVIRLSWEKVLRLIGKGLDDLDMNKEFDTVLAIMKGGGLVADVVFKSGVAWNIVKVHASRYDENGRVVNEKVQVNADIKGRIVGKVLIVDDILDSGDTVIAVVDKLQIKDAEVFVPLARKVWKRRQYIKGMDIHVGEYVGNEWVMFPWEWRR